MDLILNDLLKFRRSHVWAVAFLVPVVAVAIGARAHAAQTPPPPPGGAHVLSPRGAGPAVPHLTGGGGLWGGGGGPPPPPPRLGIPGV